MKPFSHLGGGPTFLNPVRLRVSSEPTEAELMRLVELVNDPAGFPDVDALRKIVEKKIMAVLAASAAYLLPGETENDNGVRYHPVGGLAALIVPGDEPGVMVMDADLHAGSVVCDITDLVADKKIVRPAFVIDALLRLLMDCREELCFDSIRTVVRKKDRDFLDMLRELGFVQAGRNKCEVSMVWPVPAGPMNGSH